jgi:hypothetical protein
VLDAKWQGRLTGEMEGAFAAEDPDALRGAGTEYVRFLHSQVQLQNMPWIMDGLSERRGSDALTTTEKH